ncbi:MAG: 50S ribosomal protein L28 [Actinobacteria bacterium]|nr:50S ribosomal protein L28 [Actinomycetota bacterium]|tara:strand:+ start:3355 stop:3561 length:207 start_codon:yes stop_codon:yes gene_type:complete
MNIREKLGLPSKAKPQFGQSRSHAMNASKKKYKPNIQNRTILFEGKMHKVKLTTREIRTLDKKGINIL